MDYTILMTDKTVMKHLENFLSRFIHTTNGNTAWVEPKPIIENIITESFKHKTSCDRPDLDFNIYLQCFVHELRTPLATVSMGLQLLKNGETPDPHILQDMTKSVGFIEEVFTKFAVIQDGNIVLNPFEPFSLKILLEEVRDLIGPMCEKLPNLTVKYQVSPEIYAWMYGDPHNIKHILLNLLKNAVKYRDSTRPTTIVVEVTPWEGHDDTTSVDSRMVRYTTTPMAPSQPIPSRPSFLSRIRGRFSNGPGSTLDTHLTDPKVVQEPPPPMKPGRRQFFCISVSDTNEPISPPIKSRLFETFNSTSGSGLGLYICKTVVELHGGTIDHEYVTPAPGNRFTMFLSLNYCFDESLHSRREHVQEPFQPEYPLSEESPLTPSFHALVVDDSDLNLKMIHKILTKSKLFDQVVITSDPHWALTVLRDHLHEIHVMFIDKNMPSMDGISLLRQLRENHYTGFAVGLTGEDRQEVVEDFLTNGADMVVTKPLDSKKLRQVMKQVNRSV